MRRTTRVGWVLAAALATVAVAAPAFAAAVNTVTIKVGKSYRVGQHITVTVSGFATSPANELDVYNTPGHRCLSDAEKENNDFSADSVLSIVVTGQFSKKVRGRAMAANVGRSYVCAYLDGYPDLSALPTTYAYAGKYWIVHS